MDDITEIYNKLGGIISEDDFRKKVDEKVDQMSGLCDTKTAAMLVAHDLGVTDTAKEVIKIKDITPEIGNVNFVAKVVSVFDVREFNRNDGTTGRVGNVMVADETGSIRLTLWDERAELIKNGSVEVGDCMEISGYAKDGYSGTEINIGKYGVMNKTDQEIEVRLDSQKISEIKDGMGDINVSGKLLDISDVRTFQKKDGSQGRVGNILIGDETGKIRVTLWDEKVDSASALNLDDAVEIINGYAKMNNFSQQVEIQIGNNSVLRKTNAEVEYKESFTPIADIIPGESYSIEGSVSGLGELREFDRDDGTTNMVSNIYVSDDSGRIRIALWGDHALLVDELDIDTPIRIIDAYSKSGFNDEIELSAGNRTRINIL
ncbi:replication factor A [Methanococcoides methylutens]|uniref:Replication factor A n=1 Tax=Methanococcoides methylutens TaxID=2226 RepID=A0A099T041_METMT|nr:MULTISPECIES: OB-fold nucleic acid binding domain-containing protein [Methanococcoides]KGK98520.1 replication factor A [Methanococcoides methylutens]UGV40422.1 replication factor A [Methanococcoides orientis]